MTEVRIEQLISTALKELSELKLCDGSIKSYRCRAFHTTIGKELNNKVFRKYHYDLVF
jgi:hypothetical protein